MFRVMAEQCTSGTLHPSFASDPGKFLKPPCPHSSTRDNSDIKQTKRGSDVGVGTAPGMQ